MKTKVKAFFIFLIFLIGISVFISWNDAVATSADNTVYSGVISIDSFVQLQVVIDPPLGMPGDTLNLQVSAKNNDNITHTPHISIQLPSHISVQSNVLPAGATRHFQTNTLTWRPVLSANGGAQQFVLPLRVDTIDVTNPEQMITAVLDVNHFDQQAETAIWIGLPPQIDTIVLPEPIAVGLPVQLRGITSGSDPIAQSWSLGDDRQVNVNNPVVVFPAVGVYELGLEASNAVGSSFASQQITVVPHPASQFTIDDDTPGLGQPVTFTNESGGQPPLSYTWDFGDGHVSSELNPVHQYQTPGVYDVRLVVENEYGHSETFWPVTVGQPPLVDMQLGDPVPVGQPLPGQAFGDESITEFLWDMGDGSSETGAQIAHIYRRSGDFYVSLTAVNDFGTTQIGRWIHVDPGALSLYLPIVMSPANSPPEGTANGDPFALTLDPVELEAPFVMQPMELPAATSKAEALLIYINEARRQFNLSPLNYVYELSVAAQKHTTDMSVYHYTGHTGSDGSFPAERLLWNGYAGAYAGEATAWGFEHAYQAVEFWVNSPDHRRIILNQWATDVGVAFTQDYTAPNVWYWTSEFGNSFGEVTSPLLRVQTPAPDLEVLNTDLVTYSWNWPMPLASGEQFGVYVIDEDGQETALGVLAAPTHGTLYRFQGAFIDATERTGLFEWVIRLENNGASVLESDPRPMSVSWNPDLPTPTPELEATIETVLPTATAVATPTPVRMHPTVTPRPTNPPPPVLVTATPVPTTEP